MPEPGPLVEPGEERRIAFSQVAGDLLESTLILFAEHVPSPHAFSNGAAEYPLGSELTRSSWCYLRQGEKTPPPQVGCGGAAGFEFAGAAVRCPWAGKPVCFAGAAGRRPWAGKPVCDHRSVPVGGQACLRPSFDALGGKVVGALRRPSNA
ncbi:hypothetical protein Vqi01_07090 [Micromonospora qiuiae]|uniref:Rieske domain-containing protein n=1 Tax=Micromonospora qiuiae TaxID=502268 RepID=A0ABQ4J616_9ACTN|nr:hypothetical protein Vqi01_07090 [Micromonospora qiuiae]